MTGGTGFLRGSNGALSADGGLFFVVVVSRPLITFRSERGLLVPGSPATWPRFDSGLQIKVVYCSCFQFLMFKLHFEVYQSLHLQIEITVFY